MAPTTLTGPAAETCAALKAQGHREFDASKRRGGRKKPTAGGVAFFSKGTDAREVDRGGATHRRRRARHLDGGRRERQVGLGVHRPAADGARGQCAAILLEPPIQAVLVEPVAAPAQREMG